MPNEEQLKTRSIFTILLPFILVFISNFCLMALEMTAGRLIARYLGSSLYTWTAVIGVVLIGITIGYYIGGRIADRFNTPKISLLFIASSFSCVLIIISWNLISDLLILWQFGWPIRVFSHMTIMFLLPCIIIGTITPVSAKIALEKGMHKGRTVGDIYAWGAAGSIAGTLAAGYYLIPTFGTIPLIWITAGILGLFSLISQFRFKPAYLWLLFLCLISFLAISQVRWAQILGGSLLLREKIDSRIIYQDESQYSYIAVKQLSVIPDKRIFLQDTLRHSDIIMGDINDLQYEYTILYGGITRMMSKNKDKLNVMFIGGGGYVFPRYIENNWFGSNIDVVEIDPRVTKAAVAAFGLDPNSSIKTINLDGRNYVDGLLEKKSRGQQIPKYDFIYEDAFNDYSVPYQLVTREFNDKISQILADDGAYIMNLIDIQNNAMFLGSVVNTLEKTFPYVYLISKEGFNATVRVTYVLLAAKKALDINAVDSEVKLKLWHPNETDLKVLKNTSNGIVLTDDYVPVENLLLPVVHQGSKEKLAERYHNEAKSLKEQGKWDQSIWNYENAIRYNPAISILAYNEIGVIYARQNKPQEAVKAFQNAVDYYNLKGNKERILGSIYLNLGILVQQINRNEDSRQYLIRAVEEFQKQLSEDANSAIAWSRLGQTLGMLNDVNNAIAAMSNAILLEPGNMGNRYSYAHMLEFQGRLDEAIGEVKSSIEAASMAGDTESVQIFNEYLKSLNLKKAQNSP